MFVTNLQLEQLVYKIVDDLGIANHVHQSMNSIYDAIKQIITTQFVIESPPFTPANTSKKESENNIKSMYFKGKFNDVEFIPDKFVTPSGNSHQLSPTDCIEHRKTYAINVYLSGTMTIYWVKTDDTTDETTTVFNKLYGFSLPIEVGNKMCVFSKALRNEIFMAHSDPDLYDGFFIVEGVLYAIYSSEKLQFNEHQTYVDAYKQQIVRCVKLSRETIYRNSYQMLVIIERSGMITVEITTIPFKDKPIPFSIMFYLLGVTSDQEIQEMIMSYVDRSTAIYELVEQEIQRAVAASRSLPKYRDGMLLPPSKAAEWMANYITDGKYATMENPNERQATIGKVYDMIDNKFMIDQSDTNDSGQLRYKKAKILALMIHDALVAPSLQSEGIDRDHLRHKRYFTPGYQMTQAIKRLFNLTIVVPIKTTLMAALSKTSPTKVSVATIIQQSLKDNKMSQALVSEIRDARDMIPVAGKMVIKSVVSESLSPVKSLLYAKSALAGFYREPLLSKDSRRSKELRQVHSSSAGYICVVTSADTGENIGMNIQKTVLTTITGYESPAILIEELGRYTGFIPWDRVDPSMTMILINGDWYGGTSNPTALVRHFRKLRADRVIHHHISIVFSTRNNRILFWTDEGRITTCFLPVISNEDEIDAYDEETHLAVAGKSGQEREKILADRMKGRPQFTQSIKYTPEIHEKLMSGAMTVEQLIAEGYVQYISAQEYINCIVADEPKRLWANRHNMLKPYTHAFIPLNLYGLPALASGLPSSSDATRACYQTNMGKQSTVFISPVVSELESKNMFTLIHTYKPMNVRPANEIVRCGGAVITAAFICTGDNGEDSLGFKMDAAARGLFLTVNFNNISLETRGTDEFWGTTPDLVGTKSGGNRTKIGGANYVPVGTVLEAGDVVIAKYFRRYNEKNEPYYVDASAVYKHHETAHVSNVQTITGDGGMTKIIVKYRIIRRPNTASKYSSPHGNKGVISLLQPESKMPYGMFTGRTPDIIINPHSIPSRMLPGEKLGDFIGECATRLGIPIPLSPFMDMDINDLYKIASQRGNKYGLEPMRDARTGLPIKHAFMVTTYRQALQKFAEAEAAARNKGKINPKSHYSEAGKTNEGGMRMGEMETWVLGAQGASEIINTVQHAETAAFHMPICQNCGNKAIYNHQEKIAKCLVCRSEGNVIMVHSKFVTNSIMDYLRSIGIKPVVIPEPYPVYQVE